MKIGDKVRFLSETGGGRVAGFQGKNVVLVEDEDGFQIPAMINEVVVIDEQQRQAQDEPHPLQPKPKPQPVVERNIPQQKAAPTPVRQGTRKGISAYLAFVPMDIKQLTTTRFESYLVNDSDYYLRVNYLQMEGASLRLRHTLEVEPDTQVFLEEFGREDLQQMERVCIQALAYKRGQPFMPKPAVSVILRIDVVKFYKLHTFQPSDFFEQPALIYTIVENDKEPTPGPSPREGRGDSFTSKVNFLPTLGEGSGVAPTSNSTHLPSPREGLGVGSPLVVDLHADKLLDTFAGMKAQDILEYQLDVFRRTLQNYARKRGTRIIFIHGKGDGVLRQAIVNELRYRYKQYTYQDASFQEYGYGATQVTIK